MQIAMCGTTAEREPGLSDTLKDLLEKMLTPDPAQRISLAGILAHEYLKGPTVPPEQLAAAVFAHRNRRARAGGAGAELATSLPSAVPHLLAEDSDEARVASPSAVTSSGPDALSAEVKANVPMVLPQDDVNQPSECTPMAVSQDDVNQASEANPRDGGELP